MATYYKPQSPIQSGEDFIYPITTADQIMKSDNSRLEQNGEIVADNSPKLGGIAASEYALKTKTVPTSRTVNGKALSSNISLSSSDVGALANGGTATNSSKLEGNTLAQIMLKAYPVGAIYISTSSTSPAYLFGGTWEQLTDRFLLGAGNAYGAGSAGGESMHTLTREELPNYKIGDLAVMVPAVHGNWSNGGIVACGLGDASRTKPGIADKSNNIIYSGIQYGWEIDSYGGGSAHNNMPPYLAVYMWKRVS